MRIILGLAVLIFVSSCKDNREEGEYYFQQEDYEEAIYYFERAIRLDPNDWTLKYDLARSFEENEQYRKAIDLYNECLTMTKPNIEIYQGRARSYMNNGDTESAIMDFTMLLI